LQKIGYLDRKISQLDQPSIFDNPRAILRYEYQSSQVKNPNFASHIWSRCGGTGIRFLIGFEEAARAGNHHGDDMSRSAFSLLV
jgi:hypothetical protein